jgi:hypothetical protein
MIQFSYALDAVGNLIRLDVSASAEQLIPHAFEVVTPACELTFPLPWTLTIEQAIKEVRFVPKRLVTGTLAETVHMTGTLPRSQYVFVPPAENFASESEILEMLEVYDQLPLEHEGRTQIEIALNSVGIIPIPLITSFNPELHDGSARDGVTAYSRHGWISNAKVYRKALVG